MTIVTKPESHYDSQRPIEFVPYFNTKSGSYSYWERLDVTRVQYDTFTYVSGAVYDGKRNTKLKLQLSVDIDAKPMPHIGNITTYAVNDKSRAFSRQLRIVYGTGRKERVAYYRHHHSEVLAIIDAMGGNEAVEVQTGIPVCSSNLKNPLTSELMRDAMVSLLRHEGNLIGYIVSIGNFTKSYHLADADMSKIDDKKKLKDGTQYPSKLFHDYRDDLLEFDEL
ncbi:TPA: hypothetical protein RQK28_000687 [Vibrio vulnificus]|nr:hypothetical protein [Vibrio vulnificus]